MPKRGRTSVLCPECEGELKPQTARIPTRDILGKKRGKQTRLVDVFHCSQCKLVFQIAMRLIEINPEEIQKI